MPRLNKPSRIIALTLGAVVAVVLTVVVAVAIANSSSHKDTPAVAACPSGQHHAHTVTIRDSSVTPKNTVAPRCDTLTIINLDSTVRLVAFGLHEHHVPYDGTTEKLLDKGQSLTVTLVQTGNFRFHDHLHDEVQGTFTVTAPQK